MSAALLHDVRTSSLVAAYRAKDLEEETQGLSVRFKHMNGRIEPLNFNFKDSYKNENTSEHK